ncbi:hypothetical protein HYALB_00004988 [Hymenoscyphus albidus]|uniref:RING-type E3 ubiquitin transferase n=1 Tax=Hymenoscyphus albidus TaxID=595503 RepID=A0A9N9LQM4_9HELO|nr:hypothetical protein HYALB_00004988 [Hymenoscyphus albidus]
MAEPIFEPAATPAGQPPDIMNDPEFATNTEMGDDGNGDSDTCRICRGEGSDSESLFHPCKCSGSIKYVHQDCLMEWLSHSQKKHCELCKTPFRFTKLYSPNMPQSLPFPLLIKHVAMHIVKNLATWLRFMLVVVVWLVFLPYALRQIWRLLFWFSDGGWPTYHSNIDAIRNATNAGALELAREMQLAASLTENGTSPVTPFHAAQTSSASIGGIMGRIVEILSPISQTLNFTDPNPPKGIYLSMGPIKVFMSDDSSNHTTNLTEFLASIPGASPSPSLLSEVSFFRNLTRSVHVNQIVISIFEGYIITFLVVVSFILVFLIREWVVQQQPGINIGAGFNAEFAGAERAREQQGQADARRNPIEERRAVRDEGHPNPIQQRERVIARPRRRNVHFGDAEEVPPHQNPAEEAVRNGILPLENGAFAPRPSPPREAFSPAVEIQRRLTEEPRMTEEFLAIWRRADSDPKEVLRIIEDENKASEMRYWVNAMKVLQDPLAHEGNSNSGTHLTDRDVDLPEFATPGPRRYSPVEASVPADSDTSSASTESWVDIQKAINIPTQEPTIEDSQPPEALGIRNDLDYSSEKGKQKANETLESSSTIPDTDVISTPSLPNLDLDSSGLDLDPFAPRPPRPRAVSDGPQRNESKSPLANNNWSFSNLPEVDKSERSEDDSSADLVHNEDPSSGKSSSTAKGPTDNADDVTRPLLANVVEPDRNPDENRGQDDFTRIYDNFDEALNSDSSDSDQENDHIIDDPIPGPVAAQANDPLPQAHEPVVPRPAEHRGLLGNVADYLWGAAGDDRQEEQGGNDEQIVQDLAAEAPFVPVAHHDLFNQADADQDREVVEAAIAAGIDPNDQDAIEDAEDFEGIMELIGMRGPIFSLVQNALFSAFLLALAVATGVWIPYNIGRTSILLVANPGPAFKLPLRLIFGCAAFLQDLTLSVLGFVSYCLILAAGIPTRLWSYAFATSATVKVIQESRLAPAAAKVSYDALFRILNGTVNTIIHVTDSEMFAFSAASHESLISIQTLIIDTVTGIWAAAAYLFTGDWRLSIGGTCEFLLDWLTYTWDILASVPVLFLKPDSWVISLGVAERTTPLDLGLSVWDGWARFWAIFSGYTALCVLGALYVRKGSPFSTSQVGREWEASLLDLLNQAGGVMKVILIISIEMLVFPLYCGLLLDAALLPLFENATIMSRINFTIESPFTSMFVHWFVGTCYMFHFALFVSMCRKIMRKGVLYFIRDPDDPTFHPVRDVLERNVATQLRKILFSALVYGALVVVCLGGVVWGLALAFKSVLPIHWSSNEPVLEFPIDLLFYNFLMPLAVKFFKPSDGLHAMYTWWFRQCARMLRLTWFMFDERKPDEEGYHVRKTWSVIFRGFKGDPSIPVETNDKDAPFENDAEMKAYFCRDGQYVRAPASDQVRIPKGGRIFMPVDEMNERLDGKWDQPDGVHGRTNELYKQVYIPPFFQLRICLFILFIWLFAAFTGVGITIVPLVFGRYVFAKMIPPHVRKNDVYAFSIGIYILGSMLYAVLHVRQFFSWLRNALALDAETPYNILRRATTITIRFARITWTYSAFLLVLPTLCTCLVEFYFILPLHTFFSADERHVVHFVQSWTLGLLYVKLTTRVILWYEDSRAAQALRAVTRNGYLDPDARLATRSFILPSIFLLSCALGWPWLIANIATKTVMRDQPQNHIFAYRYAYPFCLAMLVVNMALWRVFGMLKQWRMMIRDEVYLIGERLHNFGDRRVVSPSVSSKVVPPVQRLDT